MEIETLVLNALRGNRDRLDIVMPDDERALVETAVGEVRIGRSAVVITLLHHDGNSEATESDPKAVLDQIPGSRGRRPRRDVIAKSSFRKITIFRQPARYAPLKRTKLLEAIVRARSGWRN